MVDIKFSELGATEVVTDLYLAGYRGSTNYRVDIGAQLDTKFDKIGGDISGDVQIGTDTVSADLVVKGDTINGNIKIGPYSNNATYGEISHEDLFGTLEWQMLLLPTGGISIAGRNNNSLQLRSYDTGTTNSVGHVVDYDASGGYNHDFTGTVRFQGSSFSLSGIPTSASGLSAGDVWRNGNVLNIV